VSATVDANLLLYASDESSPRRVVAEARLRDLAAGPQLLYVFWPVVVAYLRIATHPGIFERPLAIDVARTNVGELLDRPHVRTPGEQPGFWTALEDSLEDGRARGNLVSDAHLVALMRQHDVRTIWTSDRDFRRFERVTVRDPFA
jgi:uncharacterized protein